MKPQHTVHIQNRINEIYKMRHLNVARYTFGNFICSGYCPWEPLENVFYKSSFQIIISVKVIQLLDALYTLNR